MNREHVRCRCGQVLDGGDMKAVHKVTGEVAGERAPGDTEPRRMLQIPGALIICAYCAAMSRFTHTEPPVMVPLTTFEFLKLELPVRQALREQQKAIRAMHRRRKN